MKTGHVIVVGVDGSEGGQRALHWAVEQARARHASVRAVAAWSWDGIETMPPVAYSPAEERDRAWKVLRREIEELPAAAREGVSVSDEVVEGRPADVLTAAARDADLLVLGSHGHSRVWHAVLGSVSEECVRKATCPVVVVPVPRSAPVPAEPALRS
ncbi:MAG TPA: universal stress protein [Micromonosporaceae bacterium]|nr:universal stress protein [Micromonosporaceae bacterium]